MRHRANPIGEADIVVCEDQRKLEAKIEIDIEKDYEAKPIVIVASEDQRKNVRELAKKNKWRIIDSSQANF